MKKLLLLTLTMLIMVFGFVSYVSSTEGSNQILKFTQNFRTLADYDVKGIYKSLVHFTPILADKKGALKDEYYHTARQQANEFRKSNKSAKNQNLEWEELGPNNVGGRTRGLLVDINNSNLIYAGSAGGGLWVSKNGAETWKPYAYNADLPVLAIGTITQSSDGVIYFASGEPSNGDNIGAAGGLVPSEGVFKLTGPDAMFEQLASTVPSNTNSVDDVWSRINRIAAHPTNSNIILATLNDFGVRLSTDGGSSWSSPTDLPDNQTAYDVEFSADGDIVYTAVGDALYKSTDSGSSFSKLNGNGVNIGGEGRKEIAISPVNDNYVYVSYSNLTGFFVKAVRTTDGGESWQRIGAYDEAFLNPFSSSGNPQGWYDQALIVDPQNENRIFLGGISLWSWSATDGWRRLDNLADLGFNSFYVHADKHEFTFDPKNPDQLFIATDGGVFRSRSAGDNTPTFIPRNKNYNVTQFYAVGADNEGRLLAGAQDNGTSYIDYVGTSPQGADIVSGGDGGFAEISHINRNILFASAQNGVFQRSPNRGESFATYLQNTGVTQCVGQQNFPDTLFITPYLLWEDTRKFNRDNIKYQQDLKAYNVYLEELAVYESYVMDSIEYVNDPNGYEPSQVLPPAEKVEEPVAVIPNGTIFTGGENVIAALDVLNVSGISECFILGRMGNQNIMTAVSTTADGKTLWAGSDNGTLRRVTGLEIDPENPEDNGWEYDGSGFPSKFLSEDTTTVSPDPLGSPWSRFIPDLPFEGEYITSVKVHPRNVNNVVVTIGGFGKTNNVYLSTNARSSKPIFEAIKGTGVAKLPDMPVYDAIFDETDPNLIYAATELGVWSYNMQGDRWFEENDGLGGRVKTLQIRQEPLRATNCPVIYIATHGRGIFRAINRAPQSCDTSLPYYALDVEENISLAQQNSLTIYPNPVQTNATISFSLNQLATVNLKVISMNGQIMQEKYIGKLAEGSNTYTFNRENLPAGNYMIALLVEDQIISKQIMIAD